jgi:dipeptidyl-peptidase-4
MSRVIILLFAVLACGRSTSAQQLLTLDDIDGPGAGVRFSGSTAARLTFLEDPWLDNDHYVWPRTDGAAGWLKVDARSGSTESLLDHGAVVDALLKIPGVAPALADGAPRRPTLFNNRHSGFVFILRGDLFYFDMRGRSATRLTSGDVPDIELPAFSPDDGSVAFVSHNDLYVTPVVSPSVRRLTTDGSTDVLNGTLDWLYSEEIYGRGNYRAFWWSPDSSRLAFLHFDETRVPIYTLTDELQYHQQTTALKYPKAGDPNPQVKLGIVAIGGGDIRWVDSSKYHDFLIVNAGWAPDSRHVAYQIQDRTQSWLDFNIADTADGSIATVFREQGRPWVERWDDASADPVWLKDGSFLWLSERSGFRHIYRYNQAGPLIRQVTSGDWEVRRINGLDEQGGWIYFTSTEASVLANNLYRIKTDGSGRQRLTGSAGTHYAVLNPAMSLFLDSRSTASTPPEARLHRTDGTELRVIERNPVPALAEFRLSTPDFLQVKTRDGFTLEAMMIKPADFDPSRRYPVYQYVYGGPHSQTVLNSWTGTRYLFHELLAQRGIIVWMCDNRTASGKGVVSTSPLHGNFGELELRDIEDCAAWLKQQSYVDPTRMAISGYSYGGFMTAYALTHPSSFSAGIAGGPVTDWRDYDTVYTERYMGLPQENAAGYVKSSPRFNAADLHGALLLIHDTGDENVHVQNTLQFALELQKAGKPFQMMLYPTAGHGISDIALVRHEHETMLNFTIQALRP